MEMLSDTKPNVAESYTHPEKEKTVRYLVDEHHSSSQSMINSKMPWTTIMKETCSVRRSAGEPGPICRKRPEDSEAATSKSVQEKECSKHEERRMGASAMEPKPPNVRTRTKQKQLS